MHALVIVQQFLRTRCPHIHAVRLTVILAAVSAAVRGRRLTLTEMGRSLPGAARVKHNIKRMDRLLGNRHLATERIDLYRVFAQRLLGTLREPVILVDWSDLTADRRWQLLRAALPVGGQSCGVGPRQLVDSRALARRIEAFSSLRSRFSGRKSAF